MTRLGDARIFLVISTEVPLFSYVLEITDADGNVSESLTFDTDAEAEAYWHSVEEAYPEDWDWVIVWKEKV